MPVDRKMKRGNFEYLYSDKAACWKWLDRCSVTMQFRYNERMITSPGIIKIYNKQMGGVG